MIKIYLIIKFQEKTINWLLIKILIKMHKINNKWIYYNYHFKTKHYIIMNLRLLFLIKTNMLVNKMKTWMKLMLHHKMEEHTNTKSKFSNYKHKCWTNKRKRRYKQLTIFKRNYNNWNKNKKKLKMN